jgi:exopolysaccharide/PEP-CTERM locus tyrosine autokinase
MVPGILQQERPPNLILITSSVPGEGKTFTSTNLAISIAMEVDHTVLAIDTDIMKRDLSKVFGVVDRPGLFDLLADHTHSLRLEDLLIRTSIPNLVILPAGHRREGSTELLASLRMMELTDEIATRYHDRVVLFDSPPVLATTTASALAPQVGQVILVAEAGKTKHETVREALQRLDRVRITGVILNKSKQPAGSGYDYYGSYYQTR